MAGAEWLSSKRGSAEIIAVTAARGFTKFKKCFAEKLESSRFFRENEVFWRQMNDTKIVVEIQKDLKRSTKDQILFTVNVGISADVLRTESFDDPRSEYALPLERCHWRQRLGRLLRDREDRWWSVRDEQRAQSLCDEIATSLREEAWPSIEDWASTSSLIRHWLEGRGPGLTEFERRSNLARLLFALGRFEDARFAVEALESASVGKGWEGTARTVATQIRTQLARQIEGET
jgi:hypothetical protein